MTHGFILRFGTQDKLNSAYELLKEKSDCLTLKKFINPANVRNRFTLVVECRVQDMIEIMEKYLSQFYSDGAEISLLHGHESAIDKMKPI